MCNGTFIQRVKYAEAGLLRHEDSRAMDNCFENDDGEYVVAALMRRADSDPALQAAIHQMFRNFASWEAIPWHKTARELAHIPTPDLARHAAERRAERRRAFREQLARWEAQRNGQTEMRLGQG